MIPVYGPHHAPEFHDDDQVAITVSNQGGAPVTVTNYGVAMGGKRSQSNLFVMELPIWATKLPVVCRTRRKASPSGGAGRGAKKSPQRARHPLPQDASMG